MERRLGANGSSSSSNRLLGSLRDPPLSSPLLLAPPGSVTCLGLPPTRLGLPPTCLVLPPSSSTMVTFFTGEEVIVGVASSAPSYSRETSTLVVKLG